MEVDMEVEQALELDREMEVDMVMMELIRLSQIFNGKNGMVTKRLAFALIQVNTMASVIVLR